jgi:diguanylate cyclase (GGDEF)-like protein
MLLDIDHFKQYNDTFGHIAGDDVLKKVAKILMQNARGTDFVARYGGEEFVVVFPYTDAEFATKAAERFRKAIEKSKWTNRAITASIGVSTLTEEIQNTATLIHAADQALYHSKASGRNRVTHCSEIEIQSIESDPNSNYYLIDSDKERIRLEATAVIFKQLLSQFSLIRERLHASEEVQNLNDTFLMLDSENYNLDRWLKSKAYEDFASMNELKNLKEFNKKLQKLMYEYQDASETVNHESFRKVKDEFTKMVFHVLECLSVLQANCESRIDANNKAA